MYNSASKVWEKQRSKLDLGEDSVEYCSSGRNESGKQAEAQGTAGRGGRSLISLNMDALYRILSV
ncbi:hypothetical protein GE21DRAFT_7405 [Neurospora crassa]|uniref:Uncharacterized protein n=1 Tax=Neurospora crassa (strain ATCC 24698 / 74-OR23-1A / CBS 708.71 / DSM 1257 / FGSC 987) TaxID=367110 RepID=Q7S7R4_NEUCR|nr:hypothetical protein NCU03829 [Neurospora crassa OR74A]EAA31982.1 hypothetical protein NCU03829 [Neurospora crassa OR74A]KHE88103.1 hypothetical protein GE21DRAFT_7405 [Neurospora crassa]|eukprot:XP_961218.1 hypothetical protein NCU03829 [Neurospora crassa OR74A]